MLCSRFLRPPGEKHGKVFQATERVFDASRDFYRWTLNGVIRHRFVTLMTAVATLGITAYLYGLVPKGFIPSQDTNQINASTEFSQDASFDIMGRLSSKWMPSSPRIRTWTHTFPEPAEVETTPATRAICNSASNRALSGKPRRNRSWINSGPC